MKNNLGVVFFLKKNFEILLAIFGRNFKLSFGILVLSSNLKNISPLKYWALKIVIFSNLGHITRDIFRAIIVY